MTTSGADTENSVHLVVIQHGLWGNHTHMDYLANRLKTAFEGKVEILNISTNEGNRTYDGIDHAGQNIVISILERLNKPDAPRVQYLSMIGYSLGGLFIRYAAGMLLAAGVLEVPVHSPVSSPPPTNAFGLKVPYTVIPANYITVATPNAGALRKSESVWGRTFNALAAFFASRSGAQIMLRDSDGDVPEPAESGSIKGSPTGSAPSSANSSPSGSPTTPLLPSTTPSSHPAPSSHSRTSTSTSSSSSSRKRCAHKERRVGLTGRPLLDLMSDPNYPFWQALSLFKTRTAYANTVNDRLVNFTTSAMEPENRYKSKDARWEVADPKYPSIVRLVVPSGTKTPEFELFEKGQGESVLEQEEEALTEMTEVTAGKVADAMNVPMESSVPSSDSKSDAESHTDTDKDGVPIETTHEASRRRQLMFYLFLPIMLPIGITVLTSFLTMSNYRYYFQGGEEKIRKRKEFIADATKRLKMLGLTSPSAVSPAGSPGSVTSADDAQLVPAEKGQDVDLIVATRKKIIERLNRLEWRKVHVRIVHRRGHAAIVVRLPGFEDVMHHLVDNFAIDF